ncbi:hypothetical protein KY310_04545 [Candidatus Woesearchaeota archaeon]|nr:hypothetical protein [Candidatus Woesearchaeota archaeon]
MKEEPLEKILNDFSDHLKEESGQHKNTSWYARIGRFFKKRFYLSSLLIGIGVGGVAAAGMQIYRHYDLVNANRQAAADIHKAREEINKSIADAIETVKGEHRTPDGASFEYSVIIYAKNKSGNTISYGENAVEHANGNLSITGIIEEQIREIVGERNYEHLRENTNSGFSPIREAQNVDREEALRWTEITDVAAARALGKYCRQLGNDLVYLTDNKPETGTFWKLKIRRHKKDGR